MLFLTLYEFCSNYAKPIGKAIISSRKVMFVCGRISSDKPINMFIWVYTQTHRDTDTRLNNVVNLVIQFSMIFFFLDQHANYYKYMKCKLHLTEEINTMKIIQFTCF